jgi:hypothetical protein
MKIENSQRGQPFRYETESGFAVETFNPVLSVFNPEFNSLGWYDLNLILFETIDSAPPPNVFRADLGEVGNPKGYEIRNSFTVFHGWESPATSLVTDATLSDPFLEIACFHVGTVVQSHLQLSALCYEKYEKHIVDHSPRRVLRIVNIPRCEQVRKEAAAKDHITHLESFILSRQHSSPNLFSAFVLSLKRFGRRVWRKYLNSSGAGSNFWRHFTPSRQVSPSFATAFSQMS